MGWADDLIPGHGSPYSINAALGLPQMTGPANDARPVNHVLGRLGPAHRRLLRLRNWSRRQQARLRGGGGRELRAPLSGRRGRDHGQSGVRGRDPVRRPASGRGWATIFYGAFGRDFVTRDGQTLMLLAVTPEAVVESAGGPLAWSADVGAMEAELGVSFAGDEGVRFTHRARLYPLFERAFSQRTASRTRPGLRRRRRHLGRLPAAGGGAERHPALQGQPGVPDDPPSECGLELSVASAPAGDDSRRTHARRGSARQAATRAAYG